MAGVIAQTPRLSATLFATRSSERRLLQSSPDWNEALGADWPDRIMQVIVSDLFHAKQGRTIARWVVPGGPTVFLKRHYTLPRLDGFFASLFPRQYWSAGMQEAARLNWVARQGIFVPRVVAAGEFRGRWGKLQSFLAVEELAGMRALHEIIPDAAKQLSPADFARWKRGLIAEVARLSRELHRRRAFHKDLYLCHFFAYDADIEKVPDDWKGRIAMIDFHRLGRYNLFWAKWQAKDLAQLLYSTFDVPGVTPRDRVRFWKLYCGGDWGGAMTPPRIVRFTAAVKADRYYKHNQKLTALAQSAPRAEGGK